jgi:ribosomal protein L11 methyltransferase
VEAATLNSAANAVPHGVARYTLPEHLPPVAPVAQVSSVAEGRFDIVLANILANPLKILAPALLDRVAPGGWLVLSGILERQADEMIALYARVDPDLPLHVWRSEDGWVCLAGRHRGAPLP